MRDEGGLFVMAFLSLLGLTYRETWLFLPQEEKVVSLFGFGPLVKKEVFAYQNIERLEITHFVKDTEDPKAIPGRRKQKPMVVFSLHLVGDAVKTIEVIPEHTSLGKTEAAAQRIAAESGLGLYVDRPRDMVQVKRDGEWAVFGITNHRLRDVLCPELFVLERGVHAPKANFVASFSPYGAFPDDEVGRKTDYDGVGSSAFDTVQKQFDRIPAEITFGNIDGGK